MLASILDKPCNKIRINWVLKHKEGSHILYNEPEVVLEQTREHFSEQFKQRNITNDERVIEEFYKPLAEIKEEWYEKLKEEISIDEWLEAIGETKNKTASGLSNIDYRLIKSASRKTQEIFRKFANTCLELGRILHK